MNIIAEFSLTSDLLPLTDVLEEPDVDQIEFEPILPTERYTLPFFRMWGQNIEDRVGTLRDESAVDSVTLLARLTNSGLFRVRWSDGTIAWLRNAVNQADVALLGATVSENEWTVRMRAHEEEDLSTFQHQCREKDLAPELTRVTTSGDGVRGTQDRVTPAQREALLLAAERGYFDRPRQVTLEELAEQVDISRQAFAGRLRRGQYNLIQNVLGNSQGR